MTTVQFHGTDVLVGDQTLSMPYAVRDAFALGESVIVLLDPNAYLNDPAYGKERRRGDNPLRNLFALTTEGDRIWEAEFPEPADYYYRISTRSPLIVLSFSSFQCEIDPTNGRILSRKFLK